MDPLIPHDVRRLARCQVDVVATRAYVSPADVRKYERDRMLVWPEQRARLDAVYLEMIVVLRRTVDRFRDWPPTPPMAARPHLTVVDAEHEG